MVDPFVPLPGNVISVYDPLCPSSAMCYLCMTLLTVVTLCTACRFFAFIKLLELQPDLILPTIQVGDAADVVVGQVAGLSFCMPVALVAFVGYNVTA